MVSADHDARGALAADLAHASRLVGPSWPIERFVAVNPLAGLVDLGFDGAIREARSWLGIQGYPGAPKAERTARTRLETSLGHHLAGEVDDLIADWCARLVVAPDGSGSPFARWRAMAVADLRMRRLTTDDDPEAPRLSGLPERAEDAALVALGWLDVDAAGRPRELRGQLARSHGWAAYATWCDEWAEPHDPAPRLSRMELVAMRLVTDALVGRAQREARCSPRPLTDPGVDPWRDRLADAEHSYRQGLLSRLEPSTTGPASLKAQAVFCIDVRSEVLRRAFEAQGPYDTLGFAGFFAIPIRFRPLGCSEAYASAPVLLQPDATATEAPVRPGDRDAVRADRQRLNQAGRRGAVVELSAGPGSMYGWAESAGWVQGPAAAARTLRPGWGWGRARPAPATVIDLSEAFSSEERCTLVETALRTMGLTAGFSPVVVVCGHRATTVANPHAAALDCGACGGNPGGPNARAFATLVNDPAVRSDLRSRGIDVPVSTLFVAAEHDTTTDSVSLLDQAAIPSDRRAEVAEVMADLQAAGEVAAATRASVLPGAPGPGPARRRARRRSADWAQVRAEWGLAGNAAMVVAHRDLTRDVDLEGRVFLHSYDDEADDDGVALETILTAPMVVAHWINAQYYFSSVDPEVYGSGDKVLHNPLPGVGVLTGAAGDLRIGLPWQSVGVGDRLYHEPLRLLTAVVAPLDRVEAVISRNAILGELFDGGWVHLAVRERDAPGWQVRTAGGDWAESRSENQGAMPCPTT